MISFLIFLGVVILLVVPMILLVMVNGLNGQIEMLNRRIIQLSMDLKNLTKPACETEVKTETEPVSEAKVIESCATVDHSAYIPRESVVEKPKQEQKNELPIQEVLVSEHKIIEKVQETAEQGKPAYTLPSKSTTKEVFNFERFIGENLINKIGIGVLVIGIGLFVKYAIENNWLNETGRVIIGFLSGGVLMALAYRFREAYRAFSSVLTGGAMVVFYFTVAIAFREYHLFGQTASFLMMVVITSFSVWLSILYNRRELAVLSLIGGMLTPFMVSRGDGNYHVLFIYITTLNIGMLALSVRKQWKELLIISFASTLLIFWLYFLQDSDMFSRYISNIARDTSLFLYASVFYIIFLLMPLVQVFNDEDYSKDHVMHIFLLVVNSFFYILAGVLLLQRMGADNYKGLLTALLAVANALVAVMLHNNKKDKVLFHLFSGLTISFVTLAAPMQFDGNNITLFWATEAVLLLWLFQKSGSVIYYISSLILLTFAFFCMITLHHIQPILYDYERHIHALEGSIFINRYFITRLYTSISFVVFGLLLRRHYSECNEHKHQVSTWLPTTIGTVAVFMLFYTGNRELYMYTNSDYTFLWKMAYFMIFTYILSVIIVLKVAFFRFRLLAVISLWAVGCLYYWIKTDTTWRLSDLSSALPFLLYWVGFVGLSGLYVVVLRFFYSQYQLRSTHGKIMMWCFNVSAIISLSIAVFEAIRQISFHNELIISNRASITILWSLIAFLQMWLGMSCKYKTLRIISLSLLAMVLCKLFLYDLSNVSQGAKIVAFVVLGVVLLVLSFLYQKIKNE